MRLLLRKAYTRAMTEAEAAEYLRIVDLYSRGCLRLARLLKISGSYGQGRLEAYVRQSIDEAIAEVYQEFKEKRQASAAHAG